MRNTYPIYEALQMGKITITLEDPVEKWLRNYVTKNYPEKPFGKLSGIVNEALKRYMEKPVK
jgi:hypothetical protein